MTVKCKVWECPWNLSNEPGGGFCSKEFVFLNPGGQCSWLYNDRGLVRPDWRTKGEVQTGTREKKEGGDADE